MQAIDLIFHQGQNQHTYAIAGNNAYKNYEIVQLIAQYIAHKTQQDLKQLRALICFVKDRQGHDYRYALNAQKLQNTLGWTPKVNFENGLQQTIEWYIANRNWCTQVLPKDNI